MPPQRRPGSILKDGRPAGKACRFLPLPGRWQQPNWRLRDLHQHDEQQGSRPTAALRRHLHGRFCLRPASPPRFTAENRACRSRDPAGTLPGPAPRPGARAAGAAHPLPMARAAAGALSVLAHADPPAEVSPRGDLRLMMRGRLGYQLSAAAIACPFTAAHFQPQQASQRRQDSAGACPICLRAFKAQEQVGRRSVAVQLWSMLLAGCSGLNTVGTLHAVARPLLAPPAPQSPSRPLPTPPPGAAVVQPHLPRGLPGILRAVFAADSGCYPPLLPALPLRVL